MENTTRHSKTFNPLVKFIAIAALVSSLMCIIASSVVYAFRFTHKPQEIFRDRTLYPGAQLTAHIKDVWCQYSPHPLDKYLCQDNIKHVTFSYTRDLMVDSVTIILKGDKSIKLGDLVNAWGIPQSQLKLSGAGSYTWQYSSAWYTCKITSPACPVNMITYRLGKYSEFKPWHGF